MHKNMLRLALFATVLHVAASSCASSIAPDTEQRPQLALHRAARYNRLSAIRSLIERGAKVDTYNEYGQMPIHRAAQFGSLQVLTFFLHELNLSPDVRALDGKTPLHYAVQSGHISCVRFLLENKATVDAHERCGLMPNIPALCRKYKSKHGWIGWGRTPFHFACMKGNSAIAKLLIEHGAAICTSAHVGLTALHFACLNNQVPIIELLLSLGADPQKESLTEGSPLFMVSQKGFTHAAQLLLAKGARADAAPPDRARIPLLAACAEGHVEIVRLLLDHGASIHVVDTYYMSPLSCACKHNQLSVVELLLARGADPNTSMKLACSQGNLELVRILIRFGADASKGDVFFIACMAGNNELMELLLASGADIDSLRGGLEPVTPLYYACTHNKTNVIEFLLSHKACPNKLSGYDDRTPLAVACSQGNLDLAELLLNYGADVNTGCALHAACDAGQLEAVKFLVAHGADIHMQDRRYHTPLERACNSYKLTDEASCYPRIVEYLLSIGAKPRPFSGIWYGIKCNGNTEIAALLLAYGFFKGAPDVLPSICKAGHLSVVQLLVKKNCIPENFKIDSSFPQPVKEYLMQALHPQPIEPNDYRYRRQAPLSSSLLTACSNAVSFRKTLDRKYKIE